MSIPDFDDIIFERLNKEYGAYFLRKRYNRVVIAAIVASCIFGCAVVIIPYLIRPEYKNNEIYTSRYVSMDKLMAPAGQPGVPLPPASSAPNRAKAPARLKTFEVRYIAPKVVDSVPPVEKSIALTSDSIAGVIELGEINVQEMKRDHTLKGVAMVMGMEEEVTDYTLKLKLCQSSGEAILISSGNGFRRRLNILKLLLLTGYKGKFMLHLL